jgi:hypothetical protein
MKQGWEYRGMRENVEEEEETRKERKEGRVEREGRGAGADNNLGEEEDDHAYHDKDGDTASRRALLLCIIERLWEHVEFLEKFGRSLHSHQSMLSLCFCSLMMITVYSPVCIFRLSASPDFTP